MSLGLDEGFNFGRTLLEQGQQGVLDSYGIGTMIRDLATPQGNVQRTDLPTNLPVLNVVAPGLNVLQGAYDLLKGGIEATRPDQPSMTKEQYEASPYFRKAIPFEEGMTPDRAASLAGFYDLKVTREHFSQKQPVASFAGQFLGQALDPINYIPVFGEVASAAAVARFGGIAGRMLLGSSEAVINTAAFSLITANTRAKFGDDVSFQAIATEIGMSALIGGVFGGGIGVLMRRGDRQAKAVRAAVDNIRTTQESLISLNEAVDGIATNGEVALTPNGMAPVEKLRTETINRSEAAKALDAETAGVTGTKAGEVAITPSGKRIEVRSEVVDLSTLQRATGTLQVRDRNNAASAAQVENIAINLDPARLMPNISADLGAPIVGPDNVVDSGNGRVMALRRAYEAYPEKAAAYRQALVDNGYEIPAGVTTPVLISRRVTEMTPESRALFNADANSSGTARMSAVELAQMDRDAIMSPSVIGAMVDGPVDSAANRPFVDRFLGMLPQNERGALVDETGTNLSADGLRRVENARMAAAYGDIDPSVVRRFAEATDDNTRAIIGAMSDAAGKWARMRQAVKAGLIGPEFDATQELTDALRALAGWREQAVREKRPASVVIREGLGQLDIFSGAMSPEAQLFVRMFYRNDHFAQETGRDALAGRFGRIVDSAFELGQPQLFGADTAVSKLEVIRNATDDIDANLFAPDDAVARAQEIGGGGERPSPGADSQGNRQATGADAGPKSAIEADAAELIRMADAGDIEGIKASPALARVTADMRSRPTTDSHADYGSEEWAANRVYKAEDGSDIVGVDKATDYMLENARTLAAKELGIEPFPIARERKAVIVIGPPAAGKSTIANQIALRIKAAIPDPDEAKKLMPEYAGGIGSNATHEESSFLTGAAMNELKDNGENLVIPKVGGSSKSIEKLRNELKEAGYTVDLMLMDVPPVEAFRRMIRRFVRTGRLIPPDYFDEVSTAPKRVFGELQEKGIMDGYARVDSQRDLPPRVSGSTLKTVAYADGDEISIGDGGGNRQPNPGRDETGKPEGRPPQQVNATRAAPEPIPEGLDAAAARVGKGEDMRALAEQHSVDLTTGDFPEMYDIEQMRAEGRLTAEDEAAIKAADDAFVAAESYGNSLKAAAACIL